MEKKLIITIGREFGAEGHEIGKALAARLGFAFYDKDLLGLAAKESGVDESALADHDEAVWGHFLSPYLTIRSLGPDKVDQLFQKQEEITYNLAAKGSCIFVGRLADYILRDEPNCIKAFIYAPMKFRVENIMKKHGITEAQAKKLVKRMDMARQSYHDYYSDKKWNRKEGKDILLNRAAFGVEGCVQILEAMARSRM